MVDRFLTALGLCSLVAAGVNPALAGGTPAERCRAAKQTAAGKKVASKMNCYAKAQARNTTVDSGCTGKADAKFAAAVAKADAQGPCPTTAPEALIESLADICVSEFVAANPSSGKCPAAISKAAAKASSAELSCSAKDITNPGTFSACEAKSHANFSHAFGKAGSCGVFEAGIEVVIDGCREVIQAATPATSTTTTTSTLPPAACCSFSVGGGIPASACLMGTPATCASHSGSAQSGTCRSDGTCGVATGPGACCDLPGGECVVTTAGFTSTLCGVVGGTFFSSATCTATGCQ